MEFAISEFTYKGTIAEAIIESKKQKKLFVVCISGMDPVSQELASNTIGDPKVAESLKKYCIVLHILEGSADAKNFAAIYPQNSVPSITVIGYNGIQLWQSDGYVSAEVLASSLEKAWLSLQIQETTATVLTAALASKKPEQSSSGSSDIGSSEQGNSPGTPVPSSSVDKHVQSSEAAPLAASVVEEHNGHEHILEDNTTSYRDKPSLRSIEPDQSRSVGDEQSTFASEETSELASPLMGGPDNSMADHISSGAKNGCPAQEKIISDHHSGVPEGDSQSLTTESNVAAIQDEMNDKLDDGKRANTSSDFYLQIRLPNGIGLQEKFSELSTLRMVKDYVDKNLGGSIGPYDLAIPYPRKVFSDQDLTKLLSELGLFNRQALIVVPRQRATSYTRGRSSTSDQTITTTNSDSTGENAGGYFAYIKRALSFINPLSYLGGGASSSTSGQSQTGMWEYGPNPALQNNFGRTGNAPSQSTSSVSGDNRNNRKPTTTTSRIGSNIHTLNHDDDNDSRFSDRNSFWNGNSTQYGGNNDGK